MTSTFCDGDDPISRRLDQPARRLDLVQALDEFIYTDVIATAEAPAHFEDAPMLGDRLRGAWGRALERQFAPRPPCAWDVFFGPPAGATALDRVRPYVIRVDRFGRTLTLTLRLIGFADCWLAESAEGWEEALGAGVAIRSGGRLRVVIRTKNVEITRRWGITVPPPPRAARVRLETPLSLRSGSHVAGDVSRLMPALGRRLQALCRWQDVDLCDAGLGRPSNVAILHEDVVVVPWLRRSSNQPKGQPVRALTGEVELASLGPTDWALLNAGEVLHAGSGCATGMGRISVFEHL